MPNVALARMRLVADTNVVVSALLWGGPPRDLLTAARERRVVIYTSGPLIAELEDVLGRAKLARRLASIGATPADLIDRYLALARFVTVRALPEAISRDPDDDNVIATAITARAELIASGDRDLLDLAVYRRITIVNAARAVALIEDIARSAR